MKTTWKKLLSGALAALMLTTGAFAQTIVTPSAEKIELPKGTNTCTFDITLHSDRDFAGADFGLKPSNDDVTLAVEPLDDAIGTFVETEKHGVNYFGFFTGSNSYKAGDYQLARITCTYEGSEARTVSLVSSKVVFIKENGKETEADTSAAPFTVTLTRVGEVVPVAPEAPVIAPNGGEFEVKQTVTLTCATAGADIYYTTNGAVPSVESTKYTAPFTVKEDTTVKAIAVKDGLTSGVVSAQFTLLNEGGGVTPGPGPVDPDKPGPVNPDKPGPVEPEKPDGLPFIDVEREDWFYGAVEYVYNNQIMSGTSATLFAPDMAMSRSMLAQVLYNLEGRPAVKDSVDFTDVAANAWYAKAVNWAASNGLVSGYGNGKFGPDDSVTREQMASILMRYAKFKGYDVSASASLDHFPDAGKVSPWAAESLRWAVGAKLISGMGDGTVNPQGEASRAQVASILMRFCVNVAK